MIIENAFPEVLSPAELVERICTLLQVVPAYVQQGRLTAPLSLRFAPFTELPQESMRIPAGSTLDEVYQVLALGHPRGPAWLRDELSQLDRYERKGGGQSVDADPVPTGLRPRRGVAAGCGRRECRVCYEVDRTDALVFVAEGSFSSPNPDGTWSGCSLARTYNYQLFVNGEEVLEIWCDLPHIRLVTAGGAYVLWPEAFWAIVCPHEIEGNDDFDDLQAMWGEAGYLYAVAMEHKRRLTAHAHLARTIAGALDRTGGWESDEQRAAAYALIADSEQTLRDASLQNYNAAEPRAGE